MLFYTWYHYSGRSVHYVAPAIEILHQRHSCNDHSRGEARSVATCSRLHVRTWELSQLRTMGIAKQVSSNKCASHFRYSIPSMLSTQQGSSKYQLLKSSGMTRSEEVKLLIGFEPGPLRQVPSFPCIKQTISL